MHAPDDDLDTGAHTSGWGLSRLHAATSVRWVAKLLSWVALLTGATALCEYVLGQPLLGYLFAGLMGMSPLTAMALCGLALSSLLGRRARPSWLLAGLASSIAFALLGAHLLLGADVLSPAVNAWLFPPSELFVGSVSPATASCLALLGVARMARLAGRHKACDVLALLAFGVAGIGLLGYAYGVKDLYSVLLFNAMAVHTAAALACLAVSMMLFQADQGWLNVVTLSNRAGAVTRRQLLLTAILPVIGWLLLSAINARAIGAPAALALVVATVFLPLVILIVKDGRVTARLDLQRQKQRRLETTIRQRLELELDQKRAELEQESAQRIVAEQVMNRAQRLDAVGQLTGGIAHDFNNLLMGISGNLELLHRHVESDPKASKYVTRATLSTEKGIRLTGQLLAFSRTQRLNVSAVSLADTVTAAFELVGNALGPDINIDMQTPDRSLFVSTDPLQLEMAILNLALNARDAMPEGGWFTVRCSPTAPPGTPPSVSIRVSDSGTGMSPEVLAKACEPFFTTKESGRGTGLGLAQVYGLCRQCGGDLKITSEPGHGSTFELVLPMAERPRANSISPQPTSVAAPLATLALPVLVVDDDDAVRTVLVDDLRVRGYQVLEADRGGKAMTILGNTRCAAAVIDFLMPEMNGAELARKARQLVPQLPIIFISGYADTLALDAIDGAVVLRKPFELDELDRLVRELAGAPGPNT
jgi:signal transduction histidine kinase/CheY-like chemotaxis protein